MKTENTIDLIHQKYMLEALEEAKKAYHLGETPIGCVIVWQDKIIGRGHNRRNTDGSVLAHAELMAISEAEREQKDWRLEDTTLYVTLEPCPMCAGAIVQARIGTVVFACSNPKAGSAGSVINVLQVKQFNHQVNLISGIAEQECSALLKAFFKELRAEKSKPYPPKPVQPEFYLASAKELASKMVGKLLCRRLDDGTVTKYRITETECYYGEKDTACHAHKGKTPRTEVMYRQGGIAYVYLCYGIHYLLNIVTGKQGFPEAVLIRGVEGYDGPGKLTKALQIDKSLNGVAFDEQGALWLEEDGSKYRIERLTRVGIAYASAKDQARKWRFKMVERKD